MDGLPHVLPFFFFNDTATTEIYTLSLHDALPISRDLVDVEYEPLPAVADPEAALEPGSPLLYDELDSNIAFVQQTGGGDIQAAFEKADRKSTRLNSSHT